MNETRVLTEEFGRCAVGRRYELYEHGCVPCTASDGGAIVVSLIFLFTLLLHAAVTARYQVRRDLQKILGALMMVVQSSVLLFSTLIHRVEGDRLSKSMQSTLRAFTVDFSSLLRVPCFFHASALSWDFGSTISDGMLSLFLSFASRWQFTAKRCNKEYDRKLDDTNGKIQMKRRNKALQYLLRLANTDQFLTLEQANNVFNYLGICMSERSLSERVKNLNGTSFLRRHEMRMLVFNSGLVNVFKQLDRVAGRMLYLRPVYFSMLAILFLTTPLVARSLLRILCWNGHE